MVTNRLRNTGLLICIACFMVGMTACSLAAEQYYSISDLREMTPEHWKVTVPGNKEQMIVPVFLPEVEYLPVLQAEWAEVTEEEFKSLLTDELVVRCDDYGFSNYINDMTDPDGERIVEMYVSRAWSDLPIATLSEKATVSIGQEATTSNVYAKNQKMSLEDAIEWSKKVYELVYEKYDGGVFIDTLQVLSPYYYAGTNKDYPFGDWTGMGCYTIAGCQTLRGVPIFDSIIYGCEATKISNLVNALSRRATADVWKLSSDDSYVILGKPWKETAVVKEDIPLCSLDKIKAILEKEIDSGKMKEIYSIKLGYVIFADSEQTYKSGKKPWKDEQFLLVPTWVVECNYTEDPNKSRSYPNRESADAFGYQSDWLYEKWMFNAQTGERYYSSSKSDSWCYAPSIIGW